MTKLLAGLLVAATLTLPTVVARAAIAQQAYVKASNTDANDTFGLMAAVSGDTMVVAARREASSATGANGNQNDNSAPSAGAVYVFVRSGTTWIQQAYLKASNTAANDNFGWSVAIWGDTVIVGAFGESSIATGINGNQNDNSAAAAGAAYVFVRNGTNWTQQAYLKASNTGANDHFGHRVGIYSNTVVVSANLEDSNATGVNGDGSNNSASDCGAAYVFVRSGTNWTQQAYLKASNADSGDFFGGSMAISGDTLAIGAANERSNATGINGDQNDNSASMAGAAYIFVRDGTNWSQQAYLKGSNTDQGDSFGSVVALMGDTLVVGATGESSNATGVNSQGTNNALTGAGAAYVFTRSETNWSQQAYLKASNTGLRDFFGSSVATSEETVAVFALEDSNAIGVDGDQNDNSAEDSGAAYVFVRSGTNWTQQAYVKASNTEAGDALNGWAGLSGDTLVVGAYSEDSNATGVNGDQSNNSAPGSGAVYVFTGLAFSPKLTAITPDGGDGYFIRGSGLTDFAYRLERATAVNGPWTTNGTTTATAPGLFEFHDINALPGQAFYRAVRQ